IVLGGTTTTLSSATPSIYGQGVIFTAMVAAVAPGAGTPTGTVTFRDGTTDLGRAILDTSGVARFSTNGPSGGPHTISAVYGGDAGFATSVSNSILQLVNGASTSTTVTASADTSVFGQSVTLTATVGGTMGTPTGSVTFKDGTTVLGTASLNVSGTAT